VGLTSALLSNGGAPPPQRAGAADSLREPIEAYRRVLQSYPKLPLIGNNPLGIDVALAATMAGALRQIESALV
jgi:hypothetical protein